MRVGYKNNRKNRKLMLIQFKNNLRSAAHRQTAKDVRVKTITKKEFAESHATYSFKFIEEPLRREITRYLYRGLDYDFNCY